DPTTPIEESWGALHELVREGKVRHGGLSNHPPELVERALAVGPVAALQHQLSLLARAAERGVLPFAEAHGLGVLTWSPLASWRPVVRSDSDPMPSTRAKRRRREQRAGTDECHRFRLEPVPPVGERIERDPRHHDDEWREPHCVHAATKAERNSGTERASRAR